MWNCYAILKEDAPHTNNHNIYQRERKQLFELQKNLEPRVAFTQSRFTW